MTRGTLVPARRSLRLGARTNGCRSGRCHRQRWMVDVARCPRSKARSKRPRVQGPTFELWGTRSDRPRDPAIEKLLAANGWMLYTRPLEAADSSLMFKKGRKACMSPSRKVSASPDQSGVYYDANRINANVPFPADATNIDVRRQAALSQLHHAATVECDPRILPQGTCRIGLDAAIGADIAAHWPNAKIDEKIENGVRAYYQPGITTAALRNRR